MLLALDTATRLSGIALLDGQTLVAELNWTSQAGQTVELLPRLDQLLTWSSLAPADVQAIAVSLGPGSFTGVRVALSVAKGMAVAHGLPVIGVPTLDASALPFAAAGRPLCAIAPAGRGRVYWARYAPTADHEHTVPVTLGDWQGWRSAYQLGGAGELAGRRREPTLCVGEIPAAFDEALLQSPPAQWLRAPDAAVTRRAAAVGVLGWQRWRSGDVDDLASLAPIYLQEP